MVTTDQPAERRTYESEILVSALEGDINCIHNVLECLGSAVPCLCQRMQETIHQSEDAGIWRCLLCFLALRKWARHSWGLYDANHVITCRRIDQAIIEVFTQDEGLAEKAVKNTILHQALDDPESLVCYAAAYILGLRGEQCAVPVLEEIIEKGTKNWKVRAIRALAIIKDESCGPLLFKALTMDRDELNRQARRALHSLGKLAEPVWLEALNYPDSHIRWEAARGLGLIGDSRAALILAEGLLDENYAVRWATADVLANLGERAVPAILTVLSCNVISEPSRQAAYHALHGASSLCVQEKIKPLLDALNRCSGVADVPCIAGRLLKEWEDTR